MFLIVHLPYHYRDNHVRARVFLCMLAYYFWSGICADT